MATDSADASSNTAFFLELTLMSFLRACFALDSGGALALEPADEPPTGVVLAEDDNDDDDAAADEDPPDTAPPSTSNAPCPIR
jgi:hypothetical protein